MQAAMPPFMSTAPRPIQHAVRDFAGERRMRPGRFVARRHHIGMAGEHQMRRAGADAGVEILHVRRAGFARRSCDAR